MPHLAIAALLLLAAPGELGSIGIFKLQTGLDPQAASVIIDALAAAVAERQVGEAITLGELNAMLDAGRVQDLLGCDDVSCWSQLAGAAGVQRVISGSVVQAGGEWRVNLQLVNVAYARVENRVSVVWPGAAATLASVAAAAADLLLLPADRLSPATLRVSSPAPGLRWRVDGEEMGADSASLAAGVHTVELSARGYVDRIEFVALRSGSTATLNGRLEPSRSDSSWGLSLQAATVLPFGAAYRSDRVGFGAVMSYWVEIFVFALQPRLALLYGPQAQSDAGYWDGSAELVANYVPLDGFISPIFGIGVGGRYLYTMEKEETRTFGSVLETSSRVAPTHSNIGVTGHVTAGLLLFGGAGVRAIANVEYALTGFGDSRPQSLSFSLGVIL